MYISCKQKEEAILIFEESKVDFAAILNPETVTHDAELMLIMYRSSKTSRAGRPGHRGGGGVEESLNPFK